MAQAATTERLVTHARPAFSIDGQLEGRLGTDLLELSTHSDEEGLDTLELRLLNWGRNDESSEPGFLYFTSDLLDLGKEIEVTAGDEDNQATIFRGVITSVEGVFPERRMPELIVRAEDGLQWLRMRKRSRTFEDATDADVAERIANDWSLAKDAETTGPSHTQIWQVNQSDLAFLRERARAVDARVAASDGGLVFRPRREADLPEPIPLTRQSELLEFHVAADLAHQRTEVRVHGWSVADKAGIHETGGEDVVASEAADGGRTGPSVLSSLGVDVPEDRHLESPATVEEARALAEGVMRRRARRFVCGRGVTDGTPSLRVGAQVDLQDLGEWFTGAYHVASVDHTYDQRSGLRTRFVAERVELGAGA